MSADRTAALRHLPSVDQLLRVLAAHADVADVPRVRLTIAVRDVLDRERRRLLAGGSPIDALALGGSALHYDIVANEFSFAWKTDKSMAKTCKVFILTLSDGQQQFARFKLSK